jgi:hypothetical protein
VAIVGQQETVAAVAVVDGLESLVECGLTTERFGYVDGSRSLVECGGGPVCLHVVEGIVTRAGELEIPVKTDPRGGSQEWAEGHRQKVSLKNTATVAEMKTRRYEHGMVFGEAVGWPGSGMATMLKGSGVRSWRIGW